MVRRGKSQQREWWLSGRERIPRQTADCRVWAASRTRKTQGQMRGCSQSSSSIQGEKAVDRAIWPATGEVSVCLLSNNKDSVLGGVAGASHSTVSGSGDVAQVEGVGDKRAVPNNIGRGELCME